MQSIFRSPPKMSGFFYEVVAKGNPAKPAGCYSVSPISLQKFLAKTNQENLWDSPKYVLISESELKAGEKVFFLENFVRDGATRREKTLPVVVTGSTTEALIEDILSKMDLLFWHDSFDASELIRFSEDRWGKLRLALEKKLETFVQDSTRDLTLQFKMSEPEAWGKEIQTARIQVTLYKGTVE